MAGEVKSVAIGFVAGLFLARFLRKRAAADPMMKNAKEDLDRLRDTGVIDSRTHRIATGMAEDGTVRPEVAVDWAVGVTSRHGAPASEPAPVNVPIPDPTVLVTGGQPQPQPQPQPECMTDADCTALYGPGHACVDGKCVFVGEPPKDDDGLGFTDLAVFFDASGTKYVRGVNPAGEMFTSLASSLEALGVDLAAAPVVKGPTAAVDVGSVDLGTGFVDPAVSVQSVTDALSKENPTLYVDPAVNLYSGHAGLVDL